MLPLSLHVSYADASGAGKDVYEYVSSDCSVAMSEIIFLQF